MATAWYSDLSADQRAAEIVSSTFLRLWAGADALPSHPAFVYGGSANASKVIRVAHHGNGAYDKMTAVAEGTDATPAAFATGHSDVTVARRVLARDIGDLARGTDPLGVLNESELAAAMFAAYTRTLLDVVANITDGFTAAVTASSVLTLDDFVDANSTLDIAEAPGERLALLHPKQWGELRKELLSVSGGSVAFDPATPDLTRVKGPGYQGRLVGVDIFTTSSVPSSGGDRKGAIVSAGAICWGDMVIPGNRQGVLIGNGKVLYEEDRKSLAGTTLVVGSSYFGAAMGIDARGVTLNSDA